MTSNISEITPETEQSMAVQVARIDPCDVPSYVVGFSVTHVPTKRSLYLDAFIPKTEIDKEGDQDELVKKAYDRLEKTIKQFQSECENQQTSIIGKRFDPSTKTLV